MKYILILSLLISMSAQAKVSLYDFVQNGRGGELGIKSECVEQIAKVPREAFQDSELKAWIKPLKEVAVSRHFFHYTNAEIFFDIFEKDETDREYVQTLINSEKRFESIMLHSYNSKGINAAGMGFYLSANPFNSRRYGAIQLHLEVSEDSKTLVDPWNAKAPVLLGRTLQKMGVVGCNQDEGVKSLYLQENGVDLAFYSYKEDWVVLLNEEAVTKTHIFSPLHSSSEVYREMMKAGKLKEMMNTEVGAAETEFVKRIYYISRCDEDSKVKTNCAWTKDEFEQFFEELVVLNDLDVLKRFVGFYSTYDLKDINHFAKTVAEIDDKETKKEVVKASCYSNDPREKVRLYLVDRVIRDADVVYQETFKKLKKEYCR